MSKYDYEKSKEIALKDYPFYALIMAAMRQADTDNVVALATAFPDTCFELHSRYNTPGGEFDPGKKEKYEAWLENEKKAIEDFTD